jgi:hypothetical protein
MFAAGFQQVLQILVGIPVAQNRLDYLRLLFPFGRLEAFPGFERLSLRDYGGFTLDKTDPQAVDIKNRAIAEPPHLPAVPTINLLLGYVGSGAAIPQVDGLPIFSDIGHRLAIFVEQGCLHAVRLLTIQPGGAPSGFFLF